MKFRQMVDVYEEALMPYEGKDLGQLIRVLAGMEEFLRSRNIDVKTHPAIQCIILRIEALQKEITPTFETLMRILQECRDIERSKTSQN